MKKTNKSQKRAKKTSKPKSQTQHSRNSKSEKRSLKQGQSKPHQGNLNSREVSKTLKEPTIKLPPITIKPKASFLLCDICDGHGYEETVEQDRVSGEEIHRKLVCPKCHGAGKIKNYHTKPNKKKPSVILHKYTKLSPQQLKRLEQMGGNGAHLKFSADGTVSLELLRRLELAKRRQPKYVLYSNEHGRDLYIADRDIVRVPKEQTPLTTNIKEALTFIQGFDDEEKKISYYGPLTKLNLKTRLL